MSFRSLSLLLLSMPIVPIAAAELSPEQLTFFESKIRPVLIESCYECHAEDSEKLKGGLLLDSKAGWMRGGDTGAAIVPGNAADSLLVQMIRHEPGYEAMPPKSKLSDAQVADMVQWINEGAYDPRDQEIGELKNVDYFNLEERKQWWSFRPIKSPAIPEVSDSDWPRTDYDNFILAVLDGKGWQPAPEASKQALLRRLSFDIIGLAPTPEEMQAFLEDTSPDAYEKQVDRLLASPHFGEKWARHWMDAVRYGESKSFEFDYVMPHAHQYRNYLIRAFNEDVPYDDFVRESFAGDLIENPRYDESGTINQSVKGPGFLYLTDGQHGPPDLHEDEARIFSGMIDATSKAFLGVTIACARCHDHKFDAITTGDYYSWYGMLRSSRLDITNAVAETKQLVPESKLRNGKPAVYDAALEDAGKDATRISDYLAATQRIAQHPDYLEYAKSGENKQQKKQAAPKLNEKVLALVEFESANAKLDKTVLTSWVRYFTMPHEHAQWPQLEPIYRSIEAAVSEKVKKLPQAHRSITTNYPTDLNQWVQTGLAFREVPEQSEQDIIISLKNEKQVVQTLVDVSQPNAGRYSGRISGSLRSPDFTLDGTPVEFYARGKGARINLIVRNYEQAGFGPTTRILSVGVNEGKWQRISIQTKLWVGQPAYLEVLHDGETRRLKAPLKSRADDSYVTISTSSSLPDTRDVWKGKPVATVVRGVWDNARRRNLSPEEGEVLAALYESGLIRSGADRSEKLKTLMTRYREIHNEIPQPVYARSLTEGTPQHEPIYIRGSHQNLSKELNPRRNLDALGGELLPEDRSGRLELAEHMVDESNPLVSRVMVNRIWHHVFGRGIVSSIDDLGELGTLPSHPELLDYLARDFIAKDWSVKTMIREIVLSSTYRMSTVPNDEALAMDPDNIYLQRMPVKRLEAEQIRDHVLYVSNNLKRDLYGASVTAYTGDLPTARGKGKSGPLDGDGRRSIYTQLRRNFMPSFLRILGMPNSIEPTGARNVTNVPAQSLALMNSEFVREQAKAWAKHLLETETDEIARIDRMHQVGLGRPAEEQEITWARDLVRDVSELYQESGKVDEVAVWQELCHVMMNRKEFIYLF
ncbi:MAG: PSD1 and planctomycete cytochrome C domain-containing protein [Opitutaceae bacterium]